MAPDWQAGVDNAPQAKCVRSRRFPVLCGVVQLGGLEPPTSCSTDRRSNQLSYNCILCEAPQKGSANSAETRCNARLWQGRNEASSTSSRRTREPITTGFC